MVLVSKFGFIQSNFKKVSKIVDLMVASVRLQDEERKFIEAPMHSFHDERQ